jgi:Methyltransferase FkbM domain
VMPDSSVPSQRRALASSANGKSGTEVQGKTLPALLDENHLPRVDLLKMDIEGSEYEVLLSTPPPVLARIRRIAMEYHGDCSPYSKRQLFDYLQKAGFTAAWDICDPLGYGVTEMIFSN